MDVILPDFMILVVPLFIFIFGTIIGSFLNVLVCRYNTGRSALKGRSCCFSCAKTLAWYELVPIVSYLAQGRRCRSCKSVLSSQYIAVELLTGILFTLVALRLGSLGVVFNPYQLLFWWVVTSVLIVIVVYDLRHTVIPDGFVFALDLLAFVALSLRGFVVQDISLGIGAALFFAALWYFSGGRAMGLGDAKLVLGIGWLLPFVKGISAIMASFYFGAIVGILLLVLRRGSITMKSEIPFAPFLAAGFFAVFLLDISLIPTL